MGLWMETSDGIRFLEGAEGPSVEVGHGGKPSYSVHAPSPAYPGDRLGENIPATGATSKILSPKAKPHGQQTERHPEPLDLREAAGPRLALYLSRSGCPLRRC